MAENLNHANRKHAKVYKRALSIFRLLLSDYCCEAWRPYMKKDTEILEKVQRRATKMVFVLQIYTYEERLGKCGLVSVEKRMLRADLLETYKICKGIEGLTQQSFFQRRRVGGKRGHQFTMFKKRV